MHGLPFDQLDVFSTDALTGNPLAVVHCTVAPDFEKMQALARWTNLSETVFVLPPQDSAADYTLRIFTPKSELPFAGHPTLGAAAAWAARQGREDAELLVQHCATGLIKVRKTGAGYAFKAPPLTRSGPPEPRFTRHLTQSVGLQDKDVKAAAWVDNGPGWCALLLHDLPALVRAKADYTALNGQRLGLVAPAAPDADHAFEVRAFSASGFEDPVTGSLQAGIAQWLRQLDLAGPEWRMAQGQQIGRNGRVDILCDGADIWVGGQVRTIISGQITLT